MYKLNYQLFEDFEIIKFLNNTVNKIKYLDKG